MKLHEQIAEGRRRLVAAGFAADTAAFDADVLARHVLGWDRARLLAHNREPAPDGFGSRFDAAIARRARREPVAFIVGTREFWGRDFAVTRATLVPRPETELIVEEALRILPQALRRSSTSAQGRAVWRSHSLQSGGRARLRDRHLPRGPARRHGERPNP